ncbi:MAG: rRNA pseudouridine synthase [Phycisphaerales bacterium]|nr:rRNA pseudouridine synthase [Phycisphaerales bacterium]
MGQSGDSNVRLQRVLAQAGVAARRACEEMIEEGRVRVNGEVVRTLPVFVDPATDEIEVDGRMLRKPERHLYLMLNKPERVLVGANDEPGMDRATIHDLVDHPLSKRLFPVGRLEYHACGLVLLTNDGELANRLSHPRYEVPKTYHLVVKGDLTPERLPLIASRLTTARRREKMASARRMGGRSGPQLAIVKNREGKPVLELTSTQPPAKELRDLLATLGLSVKRLERVSLGPLRLTGLARGRWRELKRDELHALRKAARPTGPKAAKAKPAGSKPGVAKPAGGKGPGAATRGKKVTPRSDKPAPRTPKKPMTGGVRPRVIGGD